MTCAHPEDPCPSGSCLFPHHECLQEKITTPLVWQSMTIYFVEFLHKGTIVHRQGYRQMENLNKAREEWKAKNTAPPAEGLNHDEYETSTYAVYVTDV